MITRYADATPFTNEPFTNFSLPHEAQAMRQALEKTQGLLGQTYPHRLTGHTLSSSATFTSYNPAKISQAIGHFPLMGVAEAEEALTRATQAFESWSRVAPAKRAHYLFEAAKRMRERKHEFSALLVLEVGKTWAEADGDTAEAIDFMEFYAREMLRLAEPAPLTPLAGEKNQLAYIPLGVGAVIPPWNFPLAICVGMTTAALVTGNTVVLKPAEDSPTIAYHFVKLMEEVGLPTGVLQLITGPGSVVGEYLVTHPKIRFISFTGSKQVGLRINELAAKTQPGQKWIKRVVAEMGGKDAILVDADANIEEAAKGIVSAAYGFQGQKCSACSRALVHEAVYDKVLEACVALTKALRVGDPAEASTQVGPVINAKAFEKISSYLAVGREEGRLVTGGQTDASKGYFIHPTIFENIGEKHRLFQEEIFGPVLAFTKVASFDEGLRLANATEFGLTGAVYSQTPAHLEKARQEFFVGNLYLNRKCTGALVGAHPFGGFNMSGTDSKAGGYDYLLLFTQAKMVSQKIS